MSRNARFGLTAALALLALVVVSFAAAASPREIYADFADNGRLDQSYSESDLRNALKNAAVQGYGNPTMTPALREEIQRRGGGGIDKVGRSDSTLPFTGVDLALLSAAGGFLLLLGWGLRRFGRARP